MAGKDVNIVVRAVNATGAGIGAAVGGLNTLKQEVGKAAGAVQLLNKGLVAVGAIAGIASALKEALSGTGDASERILKGVQALPFGIGEAAKLGEQLYDVFSGAADEAERLARAGKDAMAMGNMETRSAESAQKAEDELKLLNIKDPFDKIREEFAQKSGAVNREMDRKESEIGGPIASTQRERDAKLALLAKQQEDAIAAERKRQLESQQKRGEAAAKEAEKSIDSFFKGVGDFFAGASNKAEDMEKEKADRMKQALDAEVAAAKESMEEEYRAAPGRTFASGNAPALESRFLRGNLQVQADPSLAVQKQTAATIAKNTTLVDQILKFLPQLKPTSNAGVTSIS